MSGESLQQPTEAANLKTLWDDCGAAIFAVMIGTAVATEVAVSFLAKPSVGDFYIAHPFLPAAAAVVIINGISGGLYLKKTLSRYAAPPTNG